MCWTCLDLAHPAVPADDVALLERAKAHEFSRNQDRQFRERLWLYAWQVISGLIYDGRLASVSIKHPYRVPTEEEMRALQGNRDTRQGLVADAIAVTLPGFLTALANGKSWRPDGGASITTYWIRAVVSNLYKQIGSWANDRHRLLYDAVRSDPFEYAEPLSAAPTDHETRLAQRAVLAKIIPKNIGDARTRAIARETRAVAALYLAGHTRMDVANALQISGSRVDYLIRKMKSEGLQLVRAGEIDVDLIPGLRIDGHQPSSRRPARATPAAHGVCDGEGAEDDPWSAL